ALPQRLALAGKRAVLRQDILVDEHGYAVRLRNLARAVLRSAIDQHDLVEQRELFYQRLLRLADNLADRGLLVDRRQRQADRQALLLLQLYEALDVAELGAGEGVLGEPAVDGRRQVALLLPDLLGLHLGRSHAVAHQ